MKLTTSIHTERERKRSTRKTHAMRLSGLDNKHTHTHAHTHTHTHTHIDIYTRDPCNLRNKD